ncbi:hypothetical protein DFP73DRAFT_540259 [Morchella snyderi]|nr:hypothetical protein DFP73DRAFT_540259 [Morchella snyderi]
MVSQRSLLSATRLLTILLASFSVISSANGAAQNEEDSAETINGITISEADQAPDCMYECPALEKYGSGSELPQCVTEQLTDSPYADMIKSGDYGSDEETLQNINEIMSCICTDVGFVKELADCVFNEPCGNNNTAMWVF